MFLITVAFGASSSHAVTPGGHDGDQKQQENYAKESFHPNSLLFKNRRFSPIGLGFKVFFGLRLLSVFSGQFNQFFTFFPNFRGKGLFAGFRRLTEKFIYICFGNGIDPTPEK